MNEEIKNNTPEGTEAGKENTNPAAAGTDEGKKDNPNPTPEEPKKGVGETIWGGLCAVGRFCKKAGPYVLAFAGGAGTATAAAYFLGGKEDQDVIDSTATELPEQKDETSNQ